MAKIYVSSTYLDLQDYRTQVEKTIRRMGHEDIAMEYYVAEDQRPIDRCLADVEACDLYIGIVAWRYGWVPKKNNRKKLSVTEMEYRQAQKCNKPCLIFLLDGKAAWSPDFIDDDKTQIKKLRHELSEKHNTGPGFKSVDELGRLVAEAIHKWEKEHGLIELAAAIPDYNLEVYFTALRKRYGVLALEGLTPPQKEEYLQIQLRSVFVEQNVRENPPPVELPKEVWEKLSREKEIHTEDLPLGITIDDVHRARESYYEKPSRPVLDVVTDSRYQHMILLGDPGSGKSTLARYLMLSLIDPAGDEKLRGTFNGYLPLLIELRSYVGLCTEGHCSTFIEFLEYLGKTEGWALTQVALHNHLKNDGRAVVIFDGLDEIFEPEQREQFTRQIVGFCNDYPQAKVVVTSRVIGYRRKILTDAGFTHFTLQDLNEKQVETFVTHWYDLAMSDRLDEAKERRERILKSFSDSSSIRQLAGNPMLLTIMAIIGKHQELPRERWKLYDHAASVLIQHWDVNKHLQDKRIEADFIGEDDKKELLRRLAYSLQSGDGGLAGNYIHRDGLQAEFENYLVGRYSQSPAHAKVIAQAMIQQFRERNFILSLYGANLYGFVHRAFLEFFCASAFVWKFEKTKDLTIEQFKNDVYGKHWEDKNWHEVLRLICGMIDEKWAGEIIEYLISQVYEQEELYDDVSNFLKTMLGVELPAQCLGELKSLAGVDGALTKFVTQSSWTARWDLIHILDERFQKQLQALPILLNCAEDENSSVRRAAISALAPYYHEGPNVLDLLHRYVVEDRDAETRKEIVSALAKHCNEDLRTWKLLCERTIEDDDTTVRSTAISSLTQYYRDAPETLAFVRKRAIEDGDAKVRSTAITSLIQKYRETPETLAFVRERAIKDNDASVRNTAVSFVAIFGRETPETLAFVRERAIKDNDASVRSTAMYSLFVVYRKASETLAFARERAIEDGDAKVRSTAISSLAERFHTNPETLALLRERAIKDDDAKVRSTAISSLAKHYHKTPETLSFLQGCAVNDKSPTSDDTASGYYPRKIALEVLAENWSKDPSILPLLHDRAENDPTIWLRERAKELIKELENKKKEDRE